MNLQSMDLMKSIESTMINKTAEDLNFHKIENDQTQFNFGSQGYTSLDSDYHTNYFGNLRGVDSNQLPDNHVDFWKNPILSYVRVQIIGGSQNLPSDSIGHSTDKLLSDISKPIFTKSVSFLDVRSTSIEFERVLRQLRNFSKFVDGWDGPESKGPEQSVIKEASEFLWYWSDDSFIPIPELYSDGAIALEFYDKEGFTLGGPEFHKNHVGVYTILNQINVIDSGYFVANSTNDLKRIANLLKKAFTDVTNQYS